MAEPDLDVVGIGNAIVDVIARVDDAFIEQHGMAKGAMTLIDEAQAKTIYAAMGPGTESSGGSVANTIAGIASFGGQAGFIGRVRDDQLGEIFGHDIRSIGVEYATPAATDGKATARCFIFVTPDAERTMMTFLGASTEISAGDVDPALIARAKITYMEGYLWDDPRAKAAIADAAGHAHAAGRKVAFSLSDPFCVDRHRDEFRQLLADHVDIVFANEAEVTSLFQTDDFDVAAAEMGKLVEIAALTRGPLGSVIVSGGETVSVPAEAVPEVVDTTGAGDLYAAGFLYGLSQGRGVAVCGRLGHIAAGEIISHVGARPEHTLATLARDRM